jgi:hypothetical protein
MLPLFLHPAPLICWVPVDTGRDSFRNLSGQVAGGDTVPFGVKGAAGVCSRGLWEQDQTSIQIAPARWSKNSQDPLHQPAAPETMGKRPEGLYAASGAKSGAWRRGRFSRR